jgi:hypothetical protein
MGELLFHMFLGLAEFFSGLIPERWKTAARTGSVWRRYLFKMLVALGSIAVGLACAVGLFGIGTIGLALVVAITNGS